MARRRVEGGSALRRQLRRLPEEVTEDIGREFKVIAPMLQSAIEEAAPKHEGRLAAAAKGQVSRDEFAVVAGYSQKRAGFKRAWIKGGFPSLWQEFGTKHHAPQPFISPTFRRLLPGMITRVERAVVAVLQKASRL